ncbi:MAG TPA: hypothetical protein VF731_06895 [Solirubrobacterales bacterium]
MIAGAVSAVAVAEVVGFAEDVCSGRLCPGMVGVGITHGDVDPSLAGVGTVEVVGTLRLDQNLRVARL